MIDCKAGAAWTASALLLLGLAACGSGSDAGPDAVTLGEQRALGEAAEMLDAQRLPAATPSATASTAP